MKQNMHVLFPAAGALFAAAALLSGVLHWPLWSLAALSASAILSAAVSAYVIFCYNAQLSGFMALCGTVSDSPKDLTKSLRKHLEGSARKLIAVEQQNSDLSLQMQLLRNRSAGIEAILDTICDAVLVTDDKDRIILSNRSSQTLLNFKPLDGQWIDVRQLPSCGQLVPLIEKTRCSKASHIRQELRFEKGGQPLICEAVFSSLQDESGRVIQVVAVLHDITRQQEIAQMKNDFVSHVSHELKTPLASINAYAEMLVDGEANDTETLHQFCSIIQGQAQRLSRLIEDILSISRIESGLVKVSRQTHSLAMVIRDAAEMITSYAQEKNITVTAPAPILYDQVYIDKDMISQVVINLLSNAVKYTPAGGAITIGSELNEVDGHVRVSVTDTGVGIPAEAIDHVFDKFYRVEANNKYAKGTGLGLNLVKQIVETVHGGKVFVTSAPGKGSTFGFVLPLLKEAAVQV